MKTARAGPPYLTCRPPGRGDSRVALRRGAVAVLSWSGRLSLQAAGLLGMGFWPGSETGPSAAERRFALALTALGLLLPSAFGRSVARAWAIGEGAARERVGVAYRRVWSLSLPAAVGLGVTADRWMPALFGESSCEGGPLLLLVIERLPWLLAAAVAQASLVACRRDGLGLRIVFGQFGLAAVLIPAALVAAGPRGAGWAAMAVETAGAVAGWASLSRLGLAPGWALQTGPALLGCLGLAAACHLTRGAPLPLVTLAGALSYGAAWRAGGRFGSLRSDAGVSLE